MNVVIALGGELVAGPRIKAALDGAAIVVAANGGCANLERIGFTPNVLVGDLDSIPDATLEELRRAIPEVLRYPARKDATDAELALDEALARGATEITVVGAFGGPRADHALANVLLLAAPSIRGRGVRLLTAEPGDTVSLLPVGDTVAGVTTDGLEWKLDKAALTLGSTYTVSNAAAARQVSVSVGAGTVILFHYFGSGF